MKTHTLFTNDLKPIPTISLPLFSAARFSHNIKRTVRTSPKTTPTNTQQHMDSRRLVGGGVLLPQPREGRGRHGPVPFAVKKNMYVFFLVHLLPTMVVGSVTKVSTKICNHVLGWAFLLVLNLYFHQLVLSTMVVYMWFNGNSMLRTGLLANQLYSTRLGLFFVLSLHAYAFFFLIATIKNLS